MARSNERRPRGKFNRPHSVSVHFSIFEYLLFRNFARHEGLAFGPAVRELAMRGLIADSAHYPDPTEDLDAYERIIATAGRAVREQ